MDSSAFTEIKERKIPEEFVRKGAGISIEYQGIHIHLDKCFDSSVLKQCLDVFRGFAC